MAVPLVFEQQMLQLARDVERNLSDGLAETIAILAAIEVQSTPIKTGRARTGWRAGVSGPVRGEVFGGSFGGNESVVARARASVTGIHHTQTGYLSNDVPYISRLNEGSSRQAPAGFVEIGVQSVEARAIDIIDPLKGVF